MNWARKWRLKGCPLCRERRALKRSLSGPRFAGQDNLGGGGESGRRQTSSESMGPIWFGRQPSGFLASPLGSLSFHPSWLREPRLGWRRM